jgi:hypothetical protein
MNLARSILIDFVLVLLTAGSLAGVLLGIGMLAWPEKIALLNRYFSRWFGTQKLKEELDRPRWVERYVYRYHKLSGAVLLLGAIFVLYSFLLSESVRRISAYLPSGLRGLWDAVAAVVIVGSVVALIVGAIVAVRPSLLRDIEKASNRWVSTEGMANVLDGMNMNVDSHVLRHRRLAGLFMIIGGGYAFVVIGQLFWWGQRAF